MPGYGLYDRALGAAYLRGLVGSCKKGRRAEMKLTLQGLQEKEQWEKRRNRTSFL